MLVIDTLPTATGPRGGARNEGGTEASRAEPRDGRGPACGVEAVPVLPRLQAVLAAARSARHALVCDTDHGTEEMPFVADVWNPLP